jgi:membrane-associated phospholipid phosphatase
MFSLRRKPYPLQLPPSGLDLVTARAVNRFATPNVEKALQVVTWAADERVLGVIFGGLWLASRDSADADWRRGADHLALCVLVASVLPHIVKRVVDRERPNRRFPLRRRADGIPLSGRAYDSFPSGHTMHLGALAAGLSQTLPAASAAIWTTCIAIAATRVLLLAHWLTDAVIGFAGGILIERMLRRKDERLA